MTVTHPGWNPQAVALWEQQQAEAAVNAVLQAWFAGPTPDLALQAAYYMFLLNDYASGVRVLEMQLPHTPDHLEVRMNLAVCCSRSGLTEQALAHGDAALRIDPEAVACWDGKAQNLHRLGRLSEASQAGTEALRLKDRNARQRRPQGTRWPARTPREFTAGKKNVVAFSLWGHNPRYLRGALRNALLVPELYPGWTARFYADESVPADLRTAVEGLGAEWVVRDPGESLRGRLGWRFAVANDPGVGFFAVRDVDSVVNVREVRAVDEWLDSGRFFHAMRDWWTHTDLLLAGMWGGVANLLPDLGAALKAYRPGAAETPNVDQWFLRDEVWPLIHDHCLVHDRCFDHGPPRRFPGPAPEGDRHVGQNEIAAWTQGQAQWLGPWLSALPCLQMPEAQRS